MPLGEEAVNMVQRDVEQGIGAWLVPADDVDGAGFRVQARFERDGGRLGNGDTGTTAVPWAFRGRHEYDVMGFLPTGRVVDVQGVTIVHETPDGPQFARFVDWVGALSQMGVSLFTRPVLDDPPRAGTIHRPRIPRDRVKPILRKPEG
jgi:hypothetical protein